eukprot:TRINITY_DN3620_c0_g1_i2.p5 TRINITY_DN3620_c0_g1~~TRINITY_DN3620_c0_g1_i2.p5  ORF type:complete len:120 (+),score=11.09 TRINITY_DN3620_c0_g1_i2:370-729(+)
MRYYPGTCQTMSVTDANSDRRRKATRTCRQQLARPNAANQTPNDARCPVPIRRNDLALLAAVAPLDIASQANIIAIPGPQAEDILRFQSTFSPTALWQIVADWGPEGVARYHAHPCTLR